MTTATPRPVTPLPRPPHPPGPLPLLVRTAESGDAAALAALSEPFVRSGALRERPSAVYAARAADFFVAEASDGTLEGCLALGVHADAVREGSASGVLYNFCVARHRQGSGLGARLLGAALTGARARSLVALFTATTGSGRLFLRYGFAPAPASAAPASWARTLDSGRGAQILARAL
ncbi:GNAT family N-acetyltransferase [Streptomyces sp. NPDC052069]|uniref:GNAT family N-acetyltransferase n=1 Tax=Streptomyces sp. NPDC052069 TaxID=3154650 RepID=UPI0034268223